MIKKKNANWWEVIFLILLFQQEGNRGFKERQRKGLFWNGRAQYTGQYWYLAQSFLHYYEIISVTKRKLRTCPKRLENELPAPGLPQTQEFGKNMTLYPTQVCRVFRMLGMTWHLVPSFSLSLVIGAFTFSVITGANCVACPSIWVCLMSSCDLSQILF
jgi:hypothetical protein